MGKKVKILISGGGTGGHIFPALSIADACKRRFDADILFVGAEGRMEMERVPAAGYEIKGLPVAGFNRKKLWKNFKVLMMLMDSIRKAKNIVATFQPDIAIGVGGYASGPTLKAAQKAGVPTLLQEQNSYPGVTNKLLAKKAEKICVAYRNTEKYFPAEKIVETGNPVRKGLTDGVKSREEAVRQFGLSPEKPVLLVVGGSLGARTLNVVMEKSIKDFDERGIQLIWQTGKSYTEKAAEAVKGSAGCITMPFISDMAAAYAAADLVVARAGAGTISELELLGKASLLVPSPNVAEDHQTKNAMALVNENAAAMVADAECDQLLAQKAIELISDKEKLKGMSEAILKLAYVDSDEKIVDEIEKILNSK